jgi:hypothetical protein
MPRLGRGAGCGLMPIEAAPVRGCRKMASRAEQAEAFTTEFYVKTVFISADSRPSGTSQVRLLSCLNRYSTVPPK